MSIENKNIDDLFRERFENFEVEPPAHIWENVKTEISSNKGGIGGGKPFLGGKIIGLSIILFTIGAISFYLLSNSFKSDTLAISDSSSEITENYLAVNSSSESELEQLSDQVAKTVDSQVEQTNNAESNNSTTSIEKASTKKEKKSKKRGVKKTQVNFDAGVTNPLEEENTGKSNLSVNRDEIKISSLTPETNSRIKFQSQQTGTYVSLSNDYQSTSLDYKEKGSRNKNDYNLKGMWKLGLYFTPEMIVYPEADGLKNYSNTIEINTSYHRNNLIFQTGLGLSFVTDEGDDMVEYRKHLGSYEDVYDVSVDETGNITYFTNTVDVYDSVASETISPTKRKFTYLQIPAFFGYGKESTRFGWFVKGGPSLFLLIDENIPENSMANSSDMVMSYESSLPGRIRTQWQFVMSVGATYKLGHKVSLSVEPTFRYHINSAYENSTLNTKHPYSIGLRTGLLLNL